MTQNIFFAEQKPRVRGETLLSRDSRRSNLLRVDWVRFPTIVSSDRAQQEQASTWLLLFGGVEVSWLWSKHTDSRERRPAVVAPAYRRLRRQGTKSCCPADCRKACARQE
ncbi:hypothetical protein C8034_v010884 [Colletotrichum sidae]|uniref:Uncharacterized protein n=1 Tax=Colletotrichum sidae TaxID=1347389 RepID=A0A4R8T148_9PEZI|nr:hypothetical protein C8034_v010884 [Colletotrichum sidae]